MSSKVQTSTLWKVDKRSSSILLLVKDNVYWGTKGALANAAPVIDASPKAVNPNFVDPGKHDYSFSGTNPAAFCGFKPIDTSKIGPLPN